MTHDAALTADDVIRLLPGVLVRPAAEGARIVTLHWLLQLQQARGEWSRALLDGELHSSAQDDRHREAVAALHRVRVALRRLRASCKEHREQLRGSRVRRALRSLERLQRATNAARDADVQHDWLEAESESLPGEARLQADLARARLAEGVDARRRRVSVALRKHLDPIVEQFAQDLSRYRTTVRVGERAATFTFAEHLASRVDLGAACVREALDDVRALDSSALPAALHHLRIQLKRQRAMLAPHTSAHAAIGAWYTMATRGQDLLGAMRDAAVLSAQSRYEGADAVAYALDGVALAHQEAFLDGWAADVESLARSQQAAAAALRKLSAGSGERVAAPLPMEFERKYLLSGCPAEAAAVPPTHISQGWIPGTALRERLRHAVSPGGQERFTRTIKLGPAQARIEIEEDTARTLFESLWPLTVSARIAKRRHVVPHGDHRWEIDVFLDRELVLAEVELTQEHETADIPSWLAPHVIRDVTGEPAYFNAVMARPDTGIPYQSQPTA